MRLLISDEVGWRVENRWKERSHKSTSHTGRCKCTWLVCAWCPSTWSFPALLTVSTSLRSLIMSRHSNGRDGTWSICCRPRGAESISTATYRTSHEFNVQMLTSDVCLERERAWRATWVSKCWPCLGASSLSLTRAHWSFNHLMVTGMLRII